jgi:DNA/RNA endonuclease YhcR with UshA esterase domain
MNKLKFVIAIAGVFLPWAAIAHHSLFDSYFLDRNVSITGKITQFVIRNPHTFILLSVVDKSGKATSWGVEWNSVSELKREGISETTLKAGDIITVNGAPSRADKDLKLTPRSIFRAADQWSWAGKIPADRYPAPTF